MINVVLEDKSGHSVATVKMEHAPRAGELLWIIGVHGPGTQESWRVVEVAHWVAASWPHDGAYHRTWCLVEPIRVQRGRAQGRGEPRDADT